MTAYPLASLMTLLIALLLFVLALNVGRARGLYGVKAPAVSVTSCSSAPSACT